MHHTVHHQTVTNLAATTTTKSHITSGSRYCRTSIKQKASSSLLQMSSSTSSDMALQLRIRLHFHLSHY
ncbi:hypothetical protein L195_g061507 [Trifolium pratense]|uniref:Uncharacterized protein n=1 Tax=Trifolium pratense TaxID=57577 RepID=A0A2K3KA67_TRIPR|nr:hypothetical protein L195_g061507 [Trifolium pratense]